MKRFTVAFVAISGCILGPACQAIVGIGDRVEAPPLGEGGFDASPPEIDADTDADSSVVENSIPAAGCPTGCLPPAPDGWTGPSAIYDGAESTKPKDCPAAYPQKQVDAQREMTATPAVCDCGTGTVSGRLCSADVYTYVAGCGMGGGTKQATVTTTQACYTNTVSGPFSIKVTAPVLTAGTCSFPNATTTKPPPSFAKVDVACGLAQPTQCEGRPECVVAPFPDAPYGRLCIHKEGEVLCPSEDYKARFVSYKKLEDTRACTACTANPAGAGCGTGKWYERLKIQDCGSALAVGTANDAEGCYAYNGPGTIVDITGWKPGAATCTAQGGAATGTASLVEPVTFCCNE
jgi:hypothetical protein